MLRSKYKEHWWNNMSGWGNVVTLIWDMMSLRILGNTQSLIKSI